MLRQQLNFIYNAGETKRFHTFPVLRTQNIAAHSWHVVMLMYLIFGQQEPGLRPVLIMAGLLHDAAEYQVGDLPAPAKRTMDERITIANLDGAPPQSFKEAWDAMEQDILAEVQMDFDKFLEPEEVLMLKLCDSLDGMIYCVRERALGNQFIAECFANFDKYVEALLRQMEPSARHGDRPTTTIEGEETPYEIARRVQSYVREDWEQVNGGF